ncbi:hypothetical protein GCM10027258_08720 [Amycolatopsis stemonae]
MLAPTSPGSSAASPSPGESTYLGHRLSSRPGTRSFGFLRIPQRDPDPGAASTGPDMTRPRTIGPEPLVRGRAVLSRGFAPGRRLRHPEPPESTWNSRPGRQGARSARRPR